MLGGTGGGSYGTNDGEAAEKIQLDPIPKIACIRSKALCDVSKKI